MEKRISFHDQILRNKRNSVFLMIGIIFIIILLGVIIGLIYSELFFIILIFAIIISMFYVLIGYNNSSKIALASVNAKIASKERYPEYHNIIEALCFASGLPKPNLYVMDNPQINAFASGTEPKKSVICVTTGALQKLNKQELEGVLAHELSHISNYDIRFMTLTAVLVGMVSILSELFLRSLWFSGGRDKDKQGWILILIGILLAILAPIFVYLVQLAISRKREYSADASSVKFVRSPTGLISALRKIKNDKILVEDKHKINKAVAPLFISNPFKSKNRDWDSTHPAIEKRIDVLKRM